MDDSWSRFWERLLFTAVGVLVAAFGLQGLWFGLVGFLVSWRPDLEAGLAGTSSGVLVVWTVLTILGSARSAALEHRKDAGRAAPRRQAPLTFPESVSRLETSGRCEASYRQCSFRDGVITENSMTKAFRIGVISVFAALLLVGSAMAGPARTDGDPEIPEGTDPVVVKGVRISDESAQQGHSKRTVDVDNLWNRFLRLYFQARLAGFGR